ncbi:class I SAM-dependent methyltransferase [Geothrix fermentans]|uniref:class I SAM-dependent methyltransferase n=1 Tax=Geothrix fermentans TaxID=44676 RepID=UPI00040783C6|nr:class I SAM-dependent methyltransferase [Geothrix fermentans]
MAARLGPIEAPPDSGLLGPLGPEISPLFTRPFLVLHRASELYTARICLLLLCDLGWETRLRAGATLDDLCTGLPDQARRPLAWMLPFLAAESLLAEEGGTYTLRGEPDLDLAGLREAVALEAPGHEANFDLLDGVRSHIGPFFTEGRDGDGLLFDLALFPHWLAYFRNGNLVYFPNNLLTLLALREGLPQGARVLELGGGAGSFAQLVAQRGAEEGWLERIAEYRFTDVAPTFLRRAQRGLGAAAPGLALAFQALDLNRPLEAQGIAPASLDAIVGINVLHVAHDLEATLLDLRSRLRPGGRLVLGECLKPALDTPLYIEFFFTFIKAFTGVRLDPRWRPRHGFLTPEAWDRALEHAGFRNIQHVPPPRPLMDNQPAFTVGAISASA